jgi:Ca2+-binding RTX toxin-like protein
MFRHLADVSPRPAAHRDSMSTVVGRFVLTAVAALSLPLLSSSPVDAAAASDGASVAGAAVTSISAGFGHTCGIRTDGTLACWGRNLEGQASPPAGTFTAVSADELRGTPRPDVIVALGGNDVVTGRGGGDLVCAGGGDDDVFGGPGDDRLLGGLGRDRLVGGPGDDRLVQGS